ncbi:hypothetical protein MYXO_01890 [Myxococcaceae bacterium]|nr:hypothetical protein MYXO_01890 [Myxococcaceae bacterium]
MRSSWKTLAALAAGLIVAPQLAAADDVQEQLKKMQERMSQLEDRLQATTDQLEVTEERAAEQQALLQKAGVTNAQGSQSGLDAFFDTLEFGGYVDATYNYNINHGDAGSDFNTTGLSLGNGLQGPGLTDSQGFNLQALKLELQRPVSVENRGGFRADIVFGEQARNLNNLAAGAYPGVISTQFDAGDYQYEFPYTKSDNQVHVSQAYAEYLTPWGDISFKMGKMYTLLGAEVVDSPYNYNVTRSILFHNLPIEHLGALAEKKYDNGITWALGVANGWDRDNGADFNKSKTLLGRFGWLGDNYGVLGNLIYGAEQVDQEDNKRGVFDLVFTANPIEALAMYLQFDFGWEEFKNSTVQLGADQKTPFWWGVAWAGRYAITDRLGVALRAEWFKDDRSGYFCSRTTGASPSTGELGNTCSVGLPVNLASSAYEVTATLDYALTSQLTARAEFRSDWVNNQQGTDRFFRSAWDRNLQSNQQLLAAQLYYRF